MRLLKRVESVEDEDNEIRVKVSKQIFNNVMSILLRVLVAYVLCTYVIAVAEVHGSSMNPTLYSGERVVLCKLMEPKNGDIAVFDFDGTMLIKRVIAVPGDRLKIEDSTVYVNDVKVVENYINENEFTGGYFEGQEITLKDEEYFIMGDNRYNSKDSRMIGVMSKESLIGTKIF